MAEWMTIVKQRNELTRRDTELGYRYTFTQPIVPVKLNFNSSSKIIGIYQFLVI